ncbi:MAG TPA: hypothetical protein VFC02_27215 [Anaerolineales bacterium]|nr:hypothetical protein [Anaerolineales bacterium]
MVYCLAVVLLEAVVDGAQLRRDKRPRHVRFLPGFAQHAHEPDQRRRMGFIAAPHQRRLAKYLGRESLDLTQERKEETDPLEDEGESDRIIL